MHHDVVCMEKSYAEVLTTCSDFLSAYPSETILLSVSNEDRADSALGIFAPSQVLCRLSSIGDTPHSGENTRSFEDTFRAITWEHLKDAPLAPFYDVEDRYQNPGGDDKFDFVVAHLEEAMRGAPEDLYITFSSAVHLTARGYAETINQRLNAYLAESSRKRVGIVVMDYFDQPRELVANVIKVNTTAHDTRGEHRYPGEGRPAPQRR